MFYSRTRSILQDYSVNLSIVDLTIPFHRLYNQPTNLIVKSKDAIISAMLEQNESLSERELEILRLVATGAANKEIARQLVISPNTVKVHLRNIFAKIGVSTRTEATLYAIQIGLINPNMAAQAFESAETAAAVETSPHSDDGNSETPSTQSFQNNSEDRELPAEPQQKIQRTPFWQVGLLVVFSLLLIGSGVVSARLLLPPSITPTITSGAQITGQTSLRWKVNAQLPAPRKGMGITEYDNRIYLVGGETSEGVDGALLSFDFQSNTYTALQDKPTPVTEVQAALIGEKIFVPGGRLANGNASNQLEVYDPRLETWETRSPLPAPVSAYALVTFEGQLYLFGGRNGDEYLASVYVYEPLEDRWSTRSPLRTPRAFAGAAVVSGKILLIGGHDGKQALANNDAYFPARDSAGEPAWEALAPLPKPRYGMGTTHLAGTIFLVGGAAVEQNVTALQYNIQEDSWAGVEAPIFGIGEQPAALAFGNFLHVFGGETETGLSSRNMTYQAIYTISVPILITDE
jgi:DNA-binding CsgD family transcriptional regulator